MEELAEILRKKKETRGAIDFERTSGRSPAGTRLPPLVNSLIPYSPSKRPRRGIDSTAGPFVSADDIFTEIAEHLRGLPREKALKKYQNRNFYEAWVARSREDVVNFCRIKSTVGKQGGIHNA